MWDGEYYDSIQGDQISNWNDCGLYCQSSTKCEAWTVDSDLACFVFETSGNFKFEQGSISGDKNCPSKIFEALYFEIEYRYIKINTKKITTLLIRHFQ